MVLNPYMGSNEPGDVVGPLEPMNLAAGPNNDMVDGPNNAMVHEPIMIQDDVVEGGPLEHDHQDNLGQPE